MTELIWIAGLLAVGHTLLEVARLLRRTARSRRHTLRAVRTSDGRPLTIEVSPLPR